MARDWKIGEVVYLKSGSPAMTVITESKPSGIGETGVTWFSEGAPNTEQRLSFPHATFPKDCLTSEEPMHNLDARIEKAQLAQSTAPVYRLSTSEKTAAMRIELSPITVNWKGVAPSQEQLENLIAEAMPRVWKRIASPVQEQREQVPEPLSASLETLRQMEVDRSSQATITAHPPSGTGQVQPQQTTPTEPRRKK